MTDVTGSRDGGGGGVDRGRFAAIVFRHFRFIVAALSAAVLISGAGEKLPDKLTGEGKPSPSSSFVFPFHRPEEEPHAKRNWNDSTASLTTREVRLKVTTVMVEPYVMLKNNQTWTGSGEVGYEGFIVDLMDRICSELGLRYQLHPTSDYGHQNMDGSWNGMMRQLIDKEVDIAAAPLYITEQREEVVDFSIPFLVVEATILLKKPPTGSTSRVETAADLLRHPDLTYGTLNTGLILRAFRTTNVTLYRTLYENIRRFHPPSFTASNEEGIERARRSSYAFILPHTIADYVIRRFPCDVIAVDRFLMRERLALAVPKGSGLLGQVNRVVRALVNEGFVERIYERWLLDRTNCNGIQSSKMYSSRHGNNGAVAVAVATDAQRTTGKHGGGVVAILLSCVFVFGRGLVS